MHPGFPDQYILFILRKITRPLIKNNFTWKKSPFTLQACHFPTDYISFFQTPTRVFITAYVIRNVYA